MSQSDAVLAWEDSLFESKSRPRLWEESRPGRTVLIIFLLNNILSNNFRGSSLDKSEPQGLGRHTVALRPGLHSQQLQGELAPGQKEAGAEALKLGLKSLQALMGDLRKRGIDSIEAKDVKSPQRFVVLPPFALIITHGLRLSKQSLAKVRRMSLHSSLSIRQRRLWSLAWSKIYWPSFCLRFQRQDFRSVFCAYSTSAHSV